MLNIKLRTERNGKVVGVRNLYARKKHGHRGIYELHFRFQSTYIPGGIALLGHHLFYINNNEIPTRELRRGLLYPFVYFSQDDKPLVDFGVMNLESYLKLLNDISFVLSHELSDLSGKLRSSRDASEPFPSPEELQARIEQRGDPALWPSVQQFVKILIDKAITEGDLPPRETWAELVKTASNKGGPAKRQYFPVKESVNALLEQVAGLKDELNTISLRLGSLESLLPGLNQPVLDRIGKLEEGVLIKEYEKHASETGFDSPSSKPALIPPGGLTIRPKAKTKSRAASKPDTRPINLEAELQGDVGAIAEIAAMRDNR